ncbi:MAG: TrkA family potassium uptake protein [Clostridia bacterium]|nr:TrkA family potassium uptake protein [Clostridia bacterium]
MKSFVVFGLDAFGQTLAVSLEQSGHQVMVIDQNDEAVRKVADITTDAIIGDPMSESVLRKAGVNAYDTAVISFPGEINNTILLTMMLKDMGVKRVVARACSELECRVLEKIGVDHIVFPERDMGEKLAHTLDKQNVFEYLRYSEDYSIVEKKVPAAWVGKTIIDLNVRRKYGVNIIAINEDGKGKINISPAPDRVFLDGDVITLIGSNKTINKLSAE